MKQTNYTQEQEKVLEILKPFVELTYGKSPRYSIEKRELAEIIKNTKEKYGIKEKLLTLRQYIAKHGCGAYHYFLFEINGISIRVIGISEFERTYQPSLLDNYYVVKDISEDNGGDCCSYQCNHNLFIEPKED